MQNVSLLLIYFEFENCFHQIGIFIVQDGCENKINKKACFVLKFAATGI